MRNWQKLLALFVIFMFNYSLVFAQVQVKGKVSDKDGYPLPGVNVVIEGTTTGTVTNIEGLFNIGAQVGQTLEIRFIGMKSQLIEVKSTDTFLEVTLLDDSELLEDVVVVGYGTQKKQSIVGAIGTASSEDLKKTGNQTNLTDALTGLIPGVSVLSITGMPGGDPTSDDNTMGFFTESEILIRGKTTWNNSGPLVLVDGVERSMNDVNMNDVENISVLKDASATAVFGVKGGNGVILITTKRGKVGKAKFNIEAQMSFDSPTKQIERVGTPSAAIARNYALQRTRRFNSGLYTSLYTADQEIEYYRNGKYPYAYANQDWEDIMIEDFSKSYNVNATASGGTERLKYFASMSYNHEGDIFKNEDLGLGYVPGFTYDRINVRTNFDLDITKTTKLSANFAGMYGVQQTPFTAGLNTVFDTFTRAAGDRPIKVYEDGVPGADVGFESNAWRAINYKGIETFPRTSIDMTYNLTQELDFIIEGLSFSGMFAYDNMFRQQGRSVRNSNIITKTIAPEFYLDGGYYDYDAEIYKLADGSPADMQDPAIVAYEIPLGGGSEGFGWMKTPNSYNAAEVELKNATRNVYYQMMLNYSKTFEKHSVTGMTMFSRQHNVTGSRFPEKREDWVGRVTYDYDGRYLFEVNGAYNGSEKFGPEYRFDFFPSLAVGWLISNERFIKDKSNMNWLNKLKVRYSDGVVGNDNVNTGSTWPYLTIYGTYNTNSRGVDQNGYGYPYLYYGLTRFNEGNPGNPDLRWEKARKQNLGLDFAAFNNTLSITADVFKENRTDMLIGANERRNTVSPVFGKPAPPANIGEAKSHGGELIVSYRNTIKKDLNYFITWNWDYARSEVIFKESTELTLPHQKPEGKPLDQTYSGISTGFLESWDDVYTMTGANGSVDNYYVLPGDVSMLDFNGDGKYFGEDDNVPYAFPTYPQNNYGIHFGGDYKGIDFSMRFVGGYNATRRVALNAFDENNLFVPTALLEETWTAEYNNAAPNYPALAMDAKTYNPTGEYFEFDGSFIRLQSVEVGYSLPQRLIEPLHLTNLKVFVNGRNLFLWTKMPNDGVGMDQPGRNYPTKKQINLGLNIRF